MEGSTSPRRHAFQRTRVTSPTDWQTSLLARRVRHSAVPTYRLHDTTGDDLGLIEHPAANVEPGDVLTPPDGREALATARAQGRTTRLRGCRRL